jgi:hypothetical protein
MNNSKIIVDRYAIAFFHIGTIFRSQCVGTLSLTTYVLSKPIKFVVCFG